MKKSRTTQQEVADIRVGMQKHSDEDDENFGALRNNFGRLEELMILNGEHLSHIRKDMNETNTTMREHFEEEKRYRQETVDWRTEMKKDVETIKKNVAPVIQEYAEGQENKRVWERTVVPMKKTGAAVIGVSAVLGAIYYIGDIILSFFARK